MIVEFIVKLNVATGTPLVDVTTALKDVLTAASWLGESTDLWAMTPIDVYVLNKEKE